MDNDRALADMLAELAASLESAGGSTGMTDPARAGGWTQASGRDGSTVPAVLPTTRAD